MTPPQDHQNERFATEINAQLAAAGAMWPELQALLDRGLDNMSPETVETLVIEQNVLSKATLANRRKVAKKLIKRYTLDASDIVFATFRHEYVQETRDPQRRLLGYLMMTTNDALMRALGTHWLRPKLEEPGEPLTYEDLEKALDDLSEDHPQIGEWAESTRTHIMQHYLGAVRDFGFAEGVQTKKVQRPRVGDRPVVFATRLSCLEGLSGARLLSSDWFSLLGLGTGEAVNRLIELNGTGLAQVRVRGEVVDIEFGEEVEAP